jgi:bacillolysin
MCRCTVVCDVVRTCDAATVKVGAPGAALLCLCLVLGMVAEVSAVTTGRGADAGPPGSTVGALRTADRRLLAELPEDTTVGVHARTGRIRYLGGTSGRPLMRPTALRRAARTAGFGRAAAGDALAPGVAARAFLSRTAPLFGVVDPQRDLVVRRTERASSGGSVVRFQQTRRGVPVLGGEIVVRLDRRGAVLAALGEALPASDQVDTRGSVPPTAARRAAAVWLARSAGVATGSVTTTSEGLTILDQRILGGPGLPGPRLVWSIDARTPRASDGLPARSQILVDADTGVVLETIERVATGLYRRICDFKSRRSRDFRCRSNYARVEGQAPTGPGQVDAAYRLMGVVDAFYRDRFGRDGLDGKGGRMVATVRYCSLIQCPLPNAFWEWGPQQATFGNGWASADDLVGHEFTHGVLDHEARLFYSYQSGALNEAFADIFGEFIDLSYPGGKDTSGSRWLFGEDLPGGAVRDLRSPGRFGDPDRVRSPRYSVGSYDHGGVHINSAIGAKAAVLITDGGTFNGYTVKALGLTKTALIEYEAMTALLTSAADYNDLFDALQQACVNLVGSRGITYADCKSVRQAVRATEMDRQPVSGGPRIASICPTGRVTQTTWSTDFEDRAETLAAWDSRVLHASRDVWYYPQNPNDDSDWDGTWASSGTRNLFGDDPPRVTDSAMVMTKGVQLPSGARMRFEHGFQFDADSKRRYDGGVVEISVDGGSWRDARRYFVQGGYTGTITRKTRNPLKGRQAFTGRSRGWGSSRLDLSSLAGRTVRFRFRIGTDRSSGSLGWYIDDVRIYRCVSDREPPTGSIALDRGADITTDGTVDVSIDADGTGSSLSRLLISNSSSTSGGILRNALEMPFREMVTDWSLESTAWGGSGGHGTRRVFVQVRDRAGNWSPVMRDSITFE